MSEVLSDKQEQRRILDLYAPRFLAGEFLVGGFFIDFAIITLHDALDVERDEHGTKLYSEDEIINRVVAAMRVAFAR
jgi:hypothetical protein